MSYGRTLLAATAVAASLVHVASAQVGGSQACAPQAAPPQFQQQQLERVCRSAADLNDLLRSGYTGRVMVPRDAKWEMKGRDGQPLAFIPLRSGIELVGERGALGSRPLLYTTYKRESYPLFQVTGNDVRIEGLHLRGPAAGDRKRGQEKVTAIAVNVDTEKQLGRRVVIADNELDEWTDSGVAVAGVERQHVERPDQYPGTPPNPEDAGLLRIERNYIHHNAKDQPATE